MIQAARERGIPVVGELELAWRLLPNEFVAVTGTNGKTTTTELLGAIYRAPGCRWRWPATSARRCRRWSARSRADATVVCECSSFQLEDTVAFAPECAVLLNLEEDHLDRHGTFEAYRDAKLRVFANQDRGRRAPIQPPAGPGGTLRIATADCDGCACAAPHNRRERECGRGRGAGARASPRRGRARRCAPSPASRTGSRRSPSATASCTSTTRRRPTSRSAASGSRRSTAACT